MKINAFTESRPDDHRGLRQELAHEKNNLAVYINGKLWKVWAGKGYADSREERAYLNSMQAWADRKSAATGKKWTVGLTGADVSEAVSAAVRMQRAADKQRAKSDASLARTPSSIPKKQEPKEKASVEESSNAAWRAGYERGLKYYRQGPANPYESGTDEFKDYAEGYHHGELDSHEKYGSSMDESVVEGKVPSEVTHRSDIDHTADIEVRGVDHNAGTFNITYNKKPYTVKTSLLSQEDFDHWQIADYEVEVINSNGKNLTDMIDWDNAGDDKTDRQIRMIDTIIAYLDTQRTSDIQYMAWKHTDADNAEELYNNITNFYKEDKQKIKQAVLWLSKNIQDADARQAFAAFVQNIEATQNTSKPQKVSEYTMYVAFSYSREGNTEMTPGMKLPGIQLTDPDDEDELAQKLDALFKKVEFKFDAFEKKIIELGETFGFGTPDLESGLGARSMYWDQTILTSEQMQTASITAKTILKFKDAINKYVQSFSSSLTKIGLPGINEYSTWEGVLSDKLTKQQEDYFTTQEGFANIAKGKINVAKMITDNIQRQGVTESTKQEILFYAKIPDGSKVYARVKDEEQWAKLQQQYRGADIKTFDYNRPDILDWLEARGINLRKFTPGMVQTMYPGSRGHNESKGLNEFAPPGSSDGGDDGFSEDTLKRLAAQWWNGDEDPRVEQTLMSAGWEIGQDEGYDNGGVFVVQAGDINGNSYISWPAEELEQGVAEGSLNEFAPGGAEGAGPYAYGIALKEMAELYAKGEFDLVDVSGMDTTSQNQSDAEEINSVADAFMNRGMEAGREAYSMVDTMVQEDMDEYLHGQGFNVDADIHAEYQNDVDSYNNSPAGQADKDQQAQQDAEWEEDLPTWRAAQVEIAAVNPKNQSSVLHSVQFDARKYNSSVGQLKSTLEQQLNKIKQSTPGSVIRITLGGKPTDIQGILAQFKQLSNKPGQNSDVTEDAPSDMIGGWTRAERESHFRQRKQDLLQDYALLGKVTTEVIRAINNEVFLTKEQIIDFYKQQITDPDLTALEYAHDNNIPSSGLLKGVLRYLLERGFSMFDIRKLMGKAAEQKKKEVAESGGKDRQWSNKDMEKLRVATRDFDDILSADGPEAIKQELIKKRIKTKPMAGPKGQLPESGVAEGDIEEASLASMRDFFNQPDDSINVNRAAGVTSGPPQNVPHQIQTIINKMYHAGKITPQEFEILRKFQQQTKINVGIKEADNNPYAIGMATAMKSTGDKPPLKKSTIKKAHEIAKKIKEE